ncbi:ABC transporter substrate-binding protein [Actinoalloteichus hymeniacidonis]|uniref:ABC-type dipeptide transport system, periplasmic component n=1 Tax=Actinoalloteichus hymeniacidonis TaxID=340345 RepID=A0AAC9HQC3_9PSEU|nr:ABC transporter substrate-binding protein [Actinoalloteichus hymeniacidonis]AOS63371.1 ABC-type dipeptide transport system, periplasmic component [Actinoalloteichus hymeniacidonis]MBB5908589.1 peptide/nickel transport system substrate-binding protein [Actinoalloteichus hymeniacidonis]
MNHVHPARPRPGRRPAYPVLLASAAVVLLTASACSDATGGSTTFTEPGPGGTLSYALSQAPDCPDPQQAGQNMAVYIARQVADSLTDQDPETGEITGWLAESWEVDDAGTEFTFQLRPEVTYSDGTPVDAESVRTNFDSIAFELGASAPLGSTYLAGYRETRVEDPLRATVVFEEPNAQFLQATSTFSLALVADATVRTPLDRRCQGEVIGSGPFVVSEFVEDQRVMLTRRDDYDWASPVVKHSGAAYLDAVDFQIIPESSVRAGSLASGQLDAVSDVLPQDTPQIQAGGGSVLSTANPGVPFILQPNVSRGPLAEEAVRDAVQLGIDRAELVETLLGEHFHPATSVLAHTTPGYADLSAELSHDPDAAAELLDRAGWTSGPEGIRVRDGEALSIDVVFSAAFSGSQAVLELVQQQLRAIGVDLRLRLVTPAESAQLQEDGDYDFYFYNTTRADPDILRTLFSTDFVNRNLRASDEELDPLLARQAATLDVDERDALVAEAQLLIVDRGFAIPLFELSQAIGVSGDVHDLAFEASARLRFHDVWLADR